MSTGVRQRPGKAPASNGDAKPSTAAATKQKKGSSLLSVGVIDVFRALTGIVLLSTLGSYLVTRGESYIWGYKRPWWTYPARLHQALTGPLELTQEELARYDGSTPGSPIYLAINRTIYDVSSSPNVYGPEGFYAKLAAKDASRSYVTTCFDPVDDLVPYLGGVEEIYVPLWLSRKPPKEDLHRAAGGNADAPVVGDKSFDDMIELMKQRIGRRKFNKLQSEAYEKARESVKEKIAMWEAMFNKKEYPVVGRVVGVDDSDESKWKKLKFCEDARKQRPAMDESIGQALKLMGKDKIDINMGKAGNMFGQSSESPDEPAAEADENLDLPEPMRKKEEKKAKKAAKKQKAEKDKLAALRAAKYDDMMVGGRWGEKGDKWWFEAAAKAKPGKQQKGEKDEAEKTEQESNNEI